MRREYKFFVAVIAYCLVDLDGHDFELNRTTFNVLRVISRVLTDKTPIRDLFNSPERLTDICDQPVQLDFIFLNLIINVQGFSLDTSE